MHEMQNRFYIELYNAIYVASKLRTKMRRNTCIDFKLGYVDAKSDSIAFCVTTYPPGLFIKIAQICMKCTIKKKSHYL